MARSTEALRFIEESVAQLATVDVDTCFHRFASDIPWLNCSVWNQCVLVMSPCLDVRFRDRWLNGGAAHGFQLVL